MKNFDNEDVKCLIATLKIIKDIRKNEKIIIRDDKLVVDDRYFQAIRRWYDNDNRYLSILFIETVIIKSVEIESEISDYIKKIKKNDSIEDQEEKLKNIKTNTNILNKLSENLNDSVSGLENIKDTYSSDSLIIKKIDNLIDQIEGFDE